MTTKQKIIYEFLRTCTEGVRIYEITKATGYDMIDANTYLDSLVKYGFVKRETKINNFSREFYYFIGK